jgi:hypothetical protein
VDLGTAAAPSLFFTGDPNTGIYSPGADQLAISTNGTQRLLIEADGDINIDNGGVFYDATNNRLAIGTTSPATPLHTKGTLRIERLDASTQWAEIYHSGSLNYYLAKNNATSTYGSHVFLSGNNSTDVEHARIDGSGRLLVGTSTATGNRKLQVTDGISANSNRFSTFSKSLAVSDNVSTNYLTITIPAFVDFADVASVGLEVSYVVTAHRQTSSRSATATFGKIYLAISRYWESSVNSPVVTNLVTTGQSLAFADQGADPTITWAVSQDAGTDQSAKNVYLGITIDNTAAGTVIQRIDGTAVMQYYSTRSTVEIA